MKAMFCPFDNFFFLFFNWKKNNNFSICVLQVGLQIQGDWNTLQIGNNICCIILLNLILWSVISESRDGYFVQIGICDMWFLTVTDIVLSDMDFESLIDLWYMCLSESAEIILNLEFDCSDLSNIVLSDMEFEWSLIHLFVWVWLRLSWIWNLTVLIWVIFYCWFGICIADWYCI